MLIKEINGDIEKIKRFNELWDELMLEDSELDYEENKMESIYDMFIKYGDWKVYLKSVKDNINIIEDDAINSAGVYVTKGNKTDMINFVSNYVMIEDPDIYWDYGLCDNATQVLNHFNKCTEDGLFDTDKQYIITMVPIFKENQPPKGGFRFHKFGKYIGVQDLSNEYLYNTDGVDMIYVFYIKEIIENYDS